MIYKMAIVEDEPAAAETLRGMIERYRQENTPANWTTFENGTVLGSKPTAINGALKFLEAARIDFFYVQGSNGNYSHLGDLSTNIAKENQATDEIYGKEYSWTLSMSSDDNFDMMLFGGKSAYATYATSGMGIYLCFEDGKISVRSANNGGEIGGVLTSGAAAGVVLDGQTKFTVTLTVCRVSETELKFKLAVNDAAVEFAAASEDAECTAVADGWVVCTLESNGYGQRLCFVPGDGAMVKVWDVALPASQN